MESSEVRPLPPSIYKFQSVLGHLLLPGAIYSFLAVLVVAMFFFLHWGYFFPLEEHSDLSFQLTGELIALAIFGLSYALKPVITHSESAKRRFGKMPPWFRFAVDGFPYATGMIVFWWRDYFSEQQFKPLSFVGAVAIWYLGGLLLSILMRRTMTDPETNEAAD